MSSTSDQPWHHSKREINRTLKDLTSLWQVGVEKRNKANDAGVLRWDERGYSSEDVGIKGKKTGPTLQKIIDINKIDPLIEKMADSKIFQSSWLLQLLIYLPLIIHPYQVSQ